MKSQLKVELRQPTPEDVENLILNMRQPDIEELLASTGNVAKTVRDSVRMSKYAWSVYADDQFVCIFGVGSPSLLSDTGIVWMLGTDLIERYKGAFIRHSKAYISAMLTVYPYMTNFVDARNTRTIRWLKFMGFTFLPARPYGIKRLPFYQFEMRRT